MNYTINSTKPVIIGIDHGYGNIKTAHAVFRTGVTAYNKEPTFKSDLLIYEGRYYIIGDEHKEFTAEKMNDPDYYILTLAAIGIELHLRGLTSARVLLAAGLPLTWVSEQKEAFKAYLLQNKEADFTFRGESYHVEFVGADVYPQGFSAVADRLREFRGVNMLCDIGNGTMNIMYINNGRAVASKCFTEKYGTHQCMLAAREKLMQRFGVSVDDTVIEEVLRYGEADILASWYPPQIFLVVLARIGIYRHNSGTYQHTFLRTIEVCEGLYTSNQADLCRLRVELGTEI